ncbi:unnamed protein product, partial [marine sediment metagenome]
ITGGDIFTEYLANVITIIGAPPEEADIKDFDFKLTKGTYDIGAQVPFTAPYDYKGVAQEGQLTISIGSICEANSPRFQSWLPKIIFVGFFDAICLTLSVT